ncbi:hypothetical protein ACMGRF_08165 [Stenotrophomonas sp. EMP41]|uniref:hypothetical protein n=1 Tax=Stenotrophomonas sp. EMP41 TaxID=3396625 RepID=UPI0039C24D7D
MKILDFEVPRAFVVWSIPISFVAGGIAFLVLYVAEHGSRADWIAAAGTWVIGLAASVLAYESNKRQRQDAEHRAKVQSASRRKSLLLMDSLANECLWLRNCLKIKRRGPEEAMNLRYFRLKFEAAEIRYSRVRFEHDGVVMGEQTVRSLYEVERHLAELIGVVSMFLKRYTDDAQAFDVKTCNETRWVEDAAVLLAMHAETFSKQLNLELQVDGQNLN